MVKLSKFISIFQFLNKFSKILQKFPSWQDCQKNAKLIIIFQTCYKNSVNNCFTVCLKTHISHLKIYFVKTPSFQPINWRQLCFKRKNFLVKLWDLRAKKSCPTIIRFGNGSLQRKTRWLCDRYIKRRKLFIHFTDIIPWL